MSLSSGNKKESLVDLMSVATCRYIRIRTTTGVKLRQAPAPLAIDIKNTERERERLQCTYRIIIIYLILCI